MTRKSLRKILVAACVLLITFVALEAAVRIWGYAEPHIHDPIYTSFDRAGDIPYIHKPNLAQARARGLAVINTDSLGLRAKMASRFDSHPSAVIHRRIGEALADYVQHQPGFAR